MKNTLKLVRTESLDLAFDVSAESLNFALKAPDGSTIEGQCGNDSLEIRNTLLKLQSQPQPKLAVRGQCITGPITSPTEHMPPATALRREPRIT